MTTSLDHLLPAPDTAIRCAEHAREIAVDPGGTAFAADLVVLVTVPGPWPKPALDHPRLAPLAAVLHGSAKPVRVLAALPADGSDGEGVSVVVYERRGPSAVERRYRVSDEADALLLAEALASGDSGGAARFLEAEHDPARPAVALCVQGSHDVCCGSEGMRLAAELGSGAGAAGERAADEIGGGAVIVHRVSHTGGHRFAPTGITFPDGRMWAGLDQGLVGRIVGRHLHSQAELAELAAACRGWWGVPGGWAQVAERAVFAQLGWSIDGSDRQVEVEVADEAASCTVTLPTIGQRWRVELRLGRLVPTIACRAPGGLPAKPGWEYEVLAVTRLP